MDGGAVKERIIAISLDGRERIKLTRKARWKEFCARASQPGVETGTRNKWMGFRKGRGMSRASQSSSRSFYLLWVEEKEKEEKLPFLNLLFLIFLNFDLSFFSLRQGSCSGNAWLESVVSGGACNGIPSISGTCSR